MTKSYYVEEIQDPTTGERISIMAETEAELERCVEEKLGEVFPDVTANPAGAGGEVSLEAPS